MRTEVLGESATTRLELTPSEASELNRIGQKLSSVRGRYGAPRDTQDASVIKCTPEGPGFYQVRISGVVGIVRASSELQIQIKPKIPMSHLIYLLTEAEELPRIDPELVSTELGTDFLEVIARWYVRAVRKLLAFGLIRDYSLKEEFLASKRGRLRVPETTRSFYSGRVGFQCEFEEFDVDTPINRVIREAASVLVRNPSLNPEIRQAATRIRNRIGELSPFDSGDLTAQRDRRGGHYEQALPLAKQLIKGEHRTFSSGSHDTCTFLIQTPLMVEEGIRNILRKNLSGDCRVKKTGGHRRGRGSLVFKPDLVFEDGTAVDQVKAVGDVKYKVHKDEWIRDDFNQTNAFMDAYGCEHGAIVQFRRSVDPPLGTENAGDNWIRSITWPVSDDIPAEDAAKELIQEASEWLDSI